MLYTIQLPRYIALPNFSRSIISILFLPKPPHSDKRVLFAPPVSDDGLTPSAQLSAIPDHNLRNTTTTSKTAAISTICVIGFSAFFTWLHRSDYRQE